MTQDESEKICRWLLSSLRGGKVSIEAGVYDAWDLPRSGRSQRPLYSLLEVRKALRYLLTENLDMRRRQESSLTQGEYHAS